jgi:hypothetical protein
MHEVGLYGDEDELVAAEVGSASGSSSIEELWKGLISVSSDTTLHNWGGFDWKGAGRRRRLGDD